MHRVAAVVLGDGRHPLGPVGREVGCGHGSAAGFGVRFGSGGHLAAVERFALGLGDQAQGAGGFGEGKAFAHVRRAAVRQEGLGEAGLRGDLGQFGRGRPLVLHDHRHAIAALGDLDGRGQQIGEGQLAVAFMQGHPAGHGTGHGDRVPAALWGRLGVCAVLGAEVGGRPGRGRTARSVQALQRGAVPQDAEHVGAQAVAAGLHDGHHRGRGDGGVHGVAALLQHLQARLRAQRVRGGNHVAGEDGGTLAGVAGLPIEGVVRVHALIFTPPARQAGYSGIGMPPLTGGHAAVPPGRQRRSGAAPAAPPPCGRPDAACAGRRRRP